MDPQVIHLIMCDSVRASKNNLLRAHIVGLQLHLQAKSTPPITQYSTILAVLRGFQGSGVLWVRVVESSSQRLIAAGARHPVRFPSEQDELLAVQFNFNAYTLPRYGLYRVELLMNDEVIAWQPFWLQPKE